MSHSKQCPRCGGEANDTRHLMEHTAGHGAAHLLRHHPIGALGLLIITGASKMLPKKFRCRDCDYEFRA